MLEVMDVLSKKKQEVMESERCSQLILHTMMSHVTLTQRGVHSLARINQKYDFFGSLQCGV